MSPLTFRCLSLACIIVVLQLFFRPPVLSLTRWCVWKGCWWFSLALASVLSCGGSPCVLWLPLWLWLRLLLPLPRSLPESDAGCLSKLTPRQGQMQEEETTTCGLFPLLVRLLERVEEGKGRCPDRVRYTGLFSLSSGGVSWGCVNAAALGASECRKRRGSLRFCRQTPTLRTRPCRQDTTYALRRPTGERRASGPWNVQRSMPPGQEDPIFAGSTYPQSTTAKGHYRFSPHKHSTRLAKAAMCN